MTPASTTLAVHHVDLLLWPKSIRVAQVTLLIFSNLSSRVLPTRNTTGQFPMSYTGSKLLSSITPVLLHFALRCLSLGYTQWLHGYIGQATELNVKPAIIKFRKSLLVNSAWWKVSQWPPPGFKVLYKYWFNCFKFSDETNYKAMYAVRWKLPVRMAWSTRRVVE